MKTFFINLLAFGTLISSVTTITSKNPVISVIHLIATFVQAAGFLILIGINFVGISYIVVYVGAIAVLFLFVIMMINIKLTDILETGSQYTKNLPLALAIGSLFIYEIFTILPFTFNNVKALASLLEILTNLNNLLLNSNTNINSFWNTTVLNNFNSGTWKPIANIDTTFTEFLQIESIGHNLYTYGAVLLIISSIILLLAMIAPIFISKPIQQ